MEATGQQYDSQLYPEVTSQQSRNSLISMVKIRYVRFLECRDINFRYNQICRYTTLLLPPFFLPLKQKALGGLKT